MSDLPLSDSSFMRKGFWDRQGANMASEWRKVVLTSKKPIFEGFGRFFTAILSEMDLNHVDTWGV